MLMLTLRTKILVHLVLLRLEVGLEAWSCTPRMKFQAGMLFMNHFQNMMIPTPTVMYNIARKFSLQQFGTREIGGVFR